MLSADSRVSDLHKDIYKIVSQKQLEADPISAQRPGAGAKIEIAPSANDGGQAPGGKCC
jgi:hypothetical protein